MNDLCTDIGFMSVNKFGEQLCGDHVEVIDQSDDSHVVVLADGLGSGVKASILSTLTSTIISTMVANGMSLESCVDTIAATLPICEVRKVAYSTFTIVRTIDNREAEIIQYDNPKLILLRDGKSFDYPQTETKIDGKTIYKTKIDLHENDFLVFTSDGAIWAGVGTTMNFGWQREEIVEFLEKWFVRISPQRLFRLCFWTSAADCTAENRGMTPPFAPSRSVGANPSICCSGRRATPRMSIR